MKARVKKADVVEAKAEVAQENPMANVMTMLQGIATGMQSMERRLNLVEQNANSTNPGNPTFSQKSNRLEKREVKEVKMGPVLLEAFTDSRKPYIAELIQVGGKLERNFFEGNPIRHTEFRGPIIETKLSGHLPIGTILEMRDGYGLSWYTVTEKGAVELEGFDKAKTLLS